MILTEFYHQRQHTKDYYSDKHMENNPRFNYNETIDSILQEATYKLTLDVIQKIKYLKAYLKNQIDDILQKESMSLTIQFLYTIAPDDDIPKLVLQTDFTLSEDLSTYDEFVNAITTPSHKIRLKSVFKIFKQKNIPPKDMIRYILSTYIDEILNTKWKILVEKKVEEIFYPLVLRYTKPAFMRFYTYLRKDLVKFLHDIWTNKSYSEFEINLDFAISLLHKRLSILEKIQNKNQSADVKDSRFTNYFIQLMCIDCLSNHTRKACSKQLLSKEIIQKTIENQIIANSVYTIDLQIVQFIKQFDLNKILDKIISEVDITFATFLKLIKETSKSQYTFGLVYYVLDLHDRLFHTTLVNDYLKDKIKIVNSNNKGINRHIIQILDNRFVEDYFRSHIQVFYNDVLKYFVNKLTEIQERMFDYLISLMSEEDNQNILGECKHNNITYYRITLVDILKKELEKVLLETCLIPESISLIVCGKIEGFYNRILDIFHQLLDSIMQNQDDIFKKMWIDLKAFDKSLENLDVYTIGKEYFSQQLSKLWATISSELFDIVRKRVFNILKTIHNNINLVVKYAIFPHEIVYQILSSIVLIWVLEPLQLSVFNHEIVDSFAFNFYVNFIKVYADKLQEIITC